MEGATTTGEMDRGFLYLIDELGINKDSPEMRIVVEEILKLKKKQVEIQRKQTAEKSVREMKTILSPEEERRLLDRDLLAKHP